MKLLMVCKGNICRSPLAEGIMQQLAAKNGLDWTVVSAGTGDWNVGMSPDRRAIRVARKHGIDISHQTGRQFDVSDFDAFDKIFVMDTNNYSNVIERARNGDDVKKVKLLIYYKNIPDPYSDDALFEPVFKLIEEGCKEIITQFTEQAITVAC